MRGCVQAEVGKTALHYASDKGHLEAVNLLLQVGGRKLAFTPDSNVSDDLCVEACGERAREASMTWTAHRQGRCVSNLFSQNETALFLAAEKGHYNVVVSLIKVGGKELGEISARRDAARCSVSKGICMP